MFSDSIMLAWLNANGKLNIWKEFHVNQKRFWFKPDKLNSELNLANGTKFVYQTLPFKYSDYIASHPSQAPRLFVSRGLITNITFTAKMGAKPLNSATVFQL